MSYVLPHRLRGLTSLPIMAAALSWGMLAPPAAAEDEPSPLVEGLPDDIAQLLQDRRYEEAIAAIDLAATKADAPRRRLAYYRGRAQHLAGKYDAAIATFQTIERDDPDGSLSAAARLARGASLARKGDFRAAELIYRDLAGRLLSHQRKDELASIYLEFADALFRPADEQTEPDYAKALDFYSQALDVGPRPDRRPAIELRMAQCQQELGQLDQAEPRLVRFLRDHPRHELEVEARYRLGQVQLALNRHENARRTWQDLLALWPDSPSPRVAEAAYHLGATYNMPEPASDSQLDLGAAALRSFLERFATHELAAAAHLDLAAAQLHRHRAADAARTLDTFLADPRYAASDRVPDARSLLGTALAAQRKFDEALAAWRDYLAQHPAHRDWTDVQRRIIDTEFTIGAEALQQRRFDDAHLRWSEFLLRYPLDPRSPPIMLAFGRMSYQQQRWDDALAHWRRLVAKYPESNEASQGQFLIAATLEEKLGQFSLALQEYKKVTWGPYQGPARTRIARLSSKSLAISTERVFRSGETPAIKLLSRNIESMTVRLYSVDLETYFRKMHLARGFEGLDVALIDPDKSFEFAVPQYAEYQELESVLELPPDAGPVTVVSVASTTLEATTLVLASDLDVIVKSSRDEVFVFAENMKTGRPWPGVRLVISDGQEVFAEGVTGADGVFQQSYSRLAGAADVRLFAVADGHVASSVVGLDGVGVSQGLQRRGYLYTDRAAYRPGQIVHVRGIVRDVASDRYTIDAGHAYELTVHDPRNRLLFQDKVALGDFGTFHANFALPAGAVPGEYRLQAADADGRSFQGAFLVRAFQLEPVQLLIETPRHVYYRGEEIEGTIQARYYYGAPLVDREIRYRLADGRVETARTDNNGQLKFKFPTREFRESQVLPLVVELAQRDLTTTAQFFLATQAFSLEVSTRRGVFVAGESFEVTLQATSAEGKPLAEDVSLEVFEQTSVDGKPGERLVEQHTARTADDGLAHVTLRIRAGGRYVLRAGGTDRFGNAVSGQHRIQISGDDDTVRLRILADRHTYQVGDLARLRLHWREQPALALVTFQGARVLGYRLVDLKQGSNDLELPMTAELAPNFELSVAVMTDARPPQDPQQARTFRRFHEAASPFVVERQLHVTIQPRPGAATVRPGDDLEVTVATRDSQGQPVAAELSLAMVEQALVDRFGAGASPIADFFRGRFREPAVRTTSSVTFSYRPATRLIDKNLLAEQERLEIEAEQRQRLEDLVGTVMQSGGMLTNSGDDLAEQRNGAADFDRNYNAINGPWDADTSVDGAVEAGWVDVGLPSGEAYAIEKPLFAIRAADLESRPDLLAPTPNANDFSGRSSGQREGKGQTLGLSSKDVFSADLDILVAGIRLQSRTTLGRHSLLEDVYSRNVEFAFHDIALERPNFKSLATLRHYSFIDARGVQNNAQVGNLGPEGVAELADRLESQGAVPLLGPLETGYWNPAIVTGDDGQATVTITVPDRATAWKLLARGVSTDTLAGQSDADIVARKDLFGELTLPQSLVDGDELQVPATIHNEAVDGGPIVVTLRTTIGSQSHEQRRTIDQAGKGLHELTFAVRVQLPEEAGTLVGPLVDAVFELRVEAAGLSDLHRRAVPVLPYGVPLAAAASGSATGDTTVWVEPPADVTLQRPALSIIIGPTVERTLLDVVLSPRHDWFKLLSCHGTPIDGTLSELMASLGLEHLLGQTREAGSPHATLLDARIRAALGTLAAAQLEDGGWSWTGRSETSDRHTSARAVWALSLARRSGYAVPPEVLDKALGYLESQVSSAAETELEVRAVLLHALAVAARADFTLANRLHRNRTNLSDPALAYLALALVEMDRAAMAGELLDMLAARRLDEIPSARKAGANWRPVVTSAEVRAVAALALAKARPNSPQLKEHVEWLLARRTPAGWSPEKVTGPAMLSLCDFFARHRFQDEHYKLTVFVNDNQAAEIDVTAASGTQTVPVPANLLDDKRRQRIHFQLSGRGRYTFQCVLSGFVPADQVKGTADVTLRRYYEPAPREFDGLEIPRGFDVVQGSYRPFRNPLTQLATPRRGRIVLQLSRQNVQNVADEQLEYLVVSEPLPSGVTVIEQSVRGGFERFEVTPGQITFFVGGRRHVDDIEFEVHGYVPGKYRAGPAIARDAFRPDWLAAALPASLEVLPPDGHSADAYRFSPRELYELGKRSFAKRDWQAAGGYLADLVANWNLKPAVHHDALRMLLDVHLELGPPSEIVRYFELVKEKLPDLEIAFDKIVKVGAAYHELGEYERSYLVFRATVESSFLRDSGVAGFLEAQGELLRSVEVMNRLLGEYPPESYVAAAQYALAQRVYAYAPQAATDARLREKKITRVDLVHRAEQMLDAFLTAYPDDPAADQAAFSLANALLELKAYRKAIQRCRRYDQRYAHGEYLDSFWYIIGFSHFALAEHEQAIAMCRKVAEATRLDPRTGRLRESANKWRALYIVGQVYHSLGQAAEAIREYTRVADRFPDARQAIDYFTRRALALDDVTLVEPRKPVRLDLQFRNVARCDLSVFRIDLMKFGLLRRDLAGITQINLAGIRPHYEQPIELGDGRDYRDRTRRLTLPLEEEGAYLVVCRGDNLYASGLVLVSPLTVDVQQDTVSGDVRVSVKQVADQKFVPDVHVKVIGSRNPQFVSGETDLRGVFAASAIQGRATVIAQAGDGRYAFFRGTTDLQPLPAETGSTAADSLDQPRAPAGSQQVELLKELQLDNGRIIQQQFDNLKNNYYNNFKRGVQLKEAF